MSEPQKPQATDFDPSDWLARAEAYGYGLTLSPDYAGRLGLSYQMPLSRPPDVEDPMYELKLPDSGNSRELCAHLLSVGAVWHVPYNATQKAIIRQMKRRGLLYHAPHSNMTSIRYKDVLAAAGELGALCMGLTPPSKQQPTPRLAGRAEA